MKNKTLLKALAALTLGGAAALGLTLAGCNNHEHTYSDKWTSDKTNHWHEATCEHTSEKKDEGAHVDADNNGKCDVCQYVLKAPDEVTTEYSVTFNMNGHGTAPATQKVDKDGKATEPTAPTADGWTFGGWYTDANCTTAYNFNTAVTADVTLYAKWTENQVVAPTQLSAPVIALNDGVITWSAVANATGYEVYEGETKVATVTELTYTIEQTEVGTYSYTVKAVGDGESYTTSVASNAVSYEVEEQEPSPVYSETLSFDSEAHIDTGVEFTVTIPETGNYTITVSGTDTQIFTKDAWDSWGAALFDATNGSSSTQVVTLTEGTHNLVLSAYDSGDYTVTITAGGTAVEDVPVLELGIASQITVPATVTHTDEEGNVVVDVEGGYDMTLTAGNAEIYTVKVTGADLPATITVDFGSGNRVQLTSENEYTAEVNLASYMEYGVVISYNSAEAGEVTLSITIDEKIVELSAPVITLTENKITWEAVEGVDHYCIYQEGETNPVGYVYPADEDALEYTITETEAGTYTYWVTAADGNNVESVISNTVSYTVDEVTPPTPELPENVTINAKDVTTIADGAELVAGSGISAVGAYTSSETAERTITYNGEQVTVGGHRWQFGNNVDAKALKINLTHDATVVVYVAGSNGTTASQIALYNANKELIDGTTQNTGLGGSEDAGCVMFDVKADTVYYLGRVGGSTVNILYIAIVYGELNETTAQTVEGVAATCTETGVKAHTITNYGRYILENGTAVAAYETIIAATGHNYTNQTVTVTTTPTKENVGEATVNCSVCDDTLTIELPALTSEDYTRGTPADGQCEYTYTHTASGVVVKFTAAEVEEEVVTNYAGTYTYTVASSNPVCTTAQGSNWDAEKMATFGTSYNSDDFKFAANTESIVLKFKVVAGQSISLKLTGYTGSNGNAVTAKVSVTGDVTSTADNTLSLSSSSTKAAQESDTFTYTASADGEVTLTIVRSNSRTVRLTEIVLTIADAE